MDYKKIIRNRKLRLAILDVLSFIPDKIMLTMQYKIKFGRSINWDNPQRFTEKVQWYKINYRNPLMRQCVDKYKVRDYVKHKGLEEILIPLYGKYDTLENVDWKHLPTSFVIKTTNGAGGLNVVICHDKSNFNFDDVRSKLQCKKQKEGMCGREWAYYNLESNIIVEKLLINEKNPHAGVEDFKIYCFSGKPQYIHVDVDRYISHKRNFYDTRWNLLPLDSEYPNTKCTINKPENFDYMLQVAQILSEDFPFVRVDLYNIQGKIYFGEMTFYPSSGYAPHNPDEWDYNFGKNFKLVRYIKKKE